MAMVDFLCGEYWKDPVSCRNILKKIHNDNFPNMTLSHFVEKKLTQKILRDNGVRKMIDYHKNFKNLLQFTFPEIDISKISRFNLYPDGHWKDPNNVKLALLDLHKKLEPNKDFLEFIYQDFSKKMLDKNGFSGIRCTLKSKDEILQFAFPDTEFDPLKFKRSANHLWSDPQNIKKAIEIMFAESKYDNINDFFFSLKYDEVKERFSSQLLKECDESVVKLIEKAGYEMGKLYKMKENLPKNYWASIENQRSYLDDFAKEHSINVITDWYMVSQRMVCEWSGSGLLMGQYKGCVSNLIMTVYPEYELVKNKFYKFGKSERDWIQHMIKKHEVTDMIYGCTKREQYHIILNGKKYFVDGYSPSLNTVYEFLGDRFHGCPMKFSKCMDSIVFSNKTYQDLYDSTVERLVAIENAGYRVIFIWETDWVARKKYFKAKKKF